MSIKMNEANANRQIEGKVVLITGAGGGIGRCLVDAFLQAGAAEVIGTSRTVQAGADPRANWVQMDVTSRTSVETVARELSGRVDILVNNSGVNSNARLMTAQAHEGSRQEMEVNYFGLLNMFEAFAPPMKARGSGVIVNMLTVLARVNLPLMASYCASKAAALSLTQAARAELEPWGVRVCAVLPPVVDTSMSSHVPPPKLKPETLASAVVEALLAGTEDVYPGAAESLRESLQKDWKSVERMFASRLPAKKA